MSKMKFKPLLRPVENIRLRFKSKQIECIMGTLTCCALYTSKNFHLYFTEIGEHVIGPDINNQV